MQKVRADKLREARNGHDGSWVAHPALVPIVTKVFDEIMPASNQVWKKLDDLQVSSSDLLEVPEGVITEEGLRTNISVTIQYVEAWLKGAGAVPIFNLMEDAATAEISRAQIWQWIRHPKGILEDGRKITLGLVQQMSVEELAKIKTAIGEDSFSSGKYMLAYEIFAKIISNDQFEDFITVPGYAYLE
jgi:malate synthase